MTSNARLQFELFEMDDASERSRVLDPARSFIVQAPAGSGKTELLMQRYLTLLAHESVQQPESVLAITFTKKAAAEMRNRVLRSLEDAKLPAPQEAHKKLSWDLARKVVTRDISLGWKILENSERLEIRTVDSFCEKVAMRTPLLAGLGQTPSIAADFDPLYADAAQRTLLMLGDAAEEDRTAIAQILLDQDNNFDRVQKLLVELLKRRDQWLRIIGASHRSTPEERAAARNALETSLQDAIRYELGTIRNQILQSVPADVLTSLLEHARYGANNIDDSHAIVPLRGITTLPGTSPDDLPLWQALCAFCLTDKQFRKRYDVNLGFPAGPIHKSRKDDCMRLMEEVAQADYAQNFCTALDRIGKLPPGQYTDQQWCSLEALFRVLPLAVANLRTVFAERGEVDHTEIALAAKAALGEDGHPTDLAFHLGYKIQHLLVDEFQDTSVSQTELLERLMQAWAPDSGATLFVVGDPMQSIYGFRQAEVTLFQRARDHGFANGEWPLEPALLTFNFRSRPELVAWFNDVFPQILTADNEVTGGVKYATSTAARDSLASSKVSFASAPSKNFATEAARVVTIVSDELATDAKSIGILVRSRRHLAHIAPALRDAGIPFRAKEIDVLGERQTVRDLHALTQAMTHLADRTAWLALLRGPWCGLDLADLWELCSNGDTHTIWDLLHSRGDQLSVRGQQVLRRNLPPIEAALAQSSRLSMRSLIESLWISIGGPAALAGPDREAKLRDAEAYFDLLQKIDAHGEVDEKRLEAEIERLYAPPDTTSGIRVELMTIHGAKGLEFDVVIVPGLNRQTETNRTQLLNWRERVIGDRHDLLLGPMEPVGTLERDKTTISKYITLLGSECGAEESKRLLYVAATRAKERLHLVTTMSEHDKPPANGSLLSLFPVEVLAEFPPQDDFAVEADSTPRTPNRMRRLPEDWSLPAAPSPLHFQPRYTIFADSRPKQHTFVRVGEDLRRIGTVTHRFLQQIGEEGVEVWTSERISKLAPVIRTLLIQEGVRQSELASGERRVRTALLNTVCEERGRWILKSRSSSNNEYALSGSVDAKLLRIKVDRTFVEDEIRWLIDYKTSDQEGTITQSYLDEQVEKYHSDLQRYAAILRAFDGLPVRGGLYFPLLQRWCEVEFSS